MLVNHHVGFVRSPSHPSFFFRFFPSISWALQLRCNMWFPTHDHPSSIQLMMKRCATSCRGQCPSPRRGGHSSHIPSSSAHPSLFLQTRFLSTVSPPSYPTGGFSHLHPIHPVRFVGLNPTKPTRSPFKVRVGKGHVKGP